ncbi:MAG TPA: sugar phosphate isomerase/epimerase [Armatimonadota bacterium]|nr:sugar phosphate isomerase/epimerase [Armatimonadota bacterium]
MTPISVQLYSVREAAAKDFPGVLKQIAEIGYKGVEPAGPHGMAPKEVKKILDDLGLVTSSAHMAMPNAENVSQLVDECKTLGIPTLISGFGGDQFKTMEGCNEAIAKLKTAMSLMEGTGIRFGIHNHWWEFQPVDGQFPEDILLNNVPGLVAELDVYWAQVGCGDAVGAVSRLKSRTPLLHCKDGMIEPKLPATAVGSGKMDIPAVVKAADPNVLEWLVVELDSCATDMMEAVAQSYRFLVEKGLGYGNK